MARRAPLELRVRGPLDRLQRVGEQLRLAALEEVGRHVGADAGMAVQRRQRRLPRRERVHQDQRQPHPMSLAQVQHLQRHDVEERPPRLDLDERLRQPQPHARAEPPVQLHDRDPAQRLARPLVVWKVLQRRQLRHRLQLLARQHPRIRIRQLLEPPSHRREHLGPRPIVAQLRQHLVRCGCHGRHATQPGVDQAQPAQSPNRSVDTMPPEAR